MNTPLRVVQISDIHLFTKPDEELLGVKTQESFRAVVELIRKEEKKVDFILLSGDLSQDGSDSSYAKLTEILRPFKVPIYFVPGNHDNVKSMMHVFPNDIILKEKRILVKNWQFILLNSQKPGAVEGYLDEYQFNFLRHCLDEYPDYKTVVAFHHHPVPIECAWLDNLGLKNAAEFWEVIAQYPSVNTIIFGHIHQETEHLINNIKLYSAPSTCFQFQCKQDHFGLENLPPGYRWFNFYDDGRVETGVKRTEKYIGTYQAGAKGY